MLVALRYDTVSICDALSPAYSLQCVYLPMAVRCRCVMCTRPAPFPIHFHVHVHFHFHFHFHCAHIESILMPRRTPSNVDTWREGGRPWVTPSVTPRQARESQGTLVPPNSHLIIAIPWSQSALALKAFRFHLRVF